MKKEELDKILDEHSRYLYGQAGGKYAYLRGADLRGANLRGAYLQGANLRGADLRGANLRGANLRGAYLQGANLRGADLQGANLRGADFRGADFQGADLRDTYLEGALLPGHQICPEEGEFIAWKATTHNILKLSVPATAKRTSSLVGRKCRAEFVKVLAVYDKHGNPCQDTIAKGWKENDFIYELGKEARADKYDDDIRVECTHGIHFFITKQEAIDWLH